MMSSPFLPFRHALRTRDVAFSLVEMLVALVIISLLAVLLFPALERASVARDTASCVSNLRQIGAGLNLYVADHQRFPPGVVNSGDKPNWARLVAPYLDGKTQPGAAWLITAHPDLPPVFRCPAMTKKRDSSGRPAVKGYGSHPGIFPQIEMMDSDPTSQFQGQWTTPAMIRRPSEIFLIADAIQHGPDGLTHGRFHNLRPAAHWWLGNEADRHKKLPEGTDFLGIDADVPGQNGPGSANVRYRHFQKMPEHNGSANFLFADGHVAPLKYGELTEGNCSLAY